MNKARRAILNNVNSILNAVDATKDMVSMSDLGEDKKAYFKADLATVEYRVNIMKGLLDSKEEE